MREHNQKWHQITLQAHNASLYESLIFTHNLTTETAGTYTFENEDGHELAEPLRGYFALKEVDGKKSKYFIEEKYYADLPIRVNSAKEIFYKDGPRKRSVVIQPTAITPFRIRPEQCWQSHREFFDMIAPFEHTHPHQWTLSKIVAIMSYVGKLFCGICSLSEFGKSSTYSILDSITKKCPVFQPRSVPGVLIQITGDGNMVFDEVHDAPGEVKSCMENFSLQVAGNAPIYINGAMKSGSTKPKYDVSQQSITYLYNVYSNYSNPEKQFWNNIWSNTKAMESRFLCLKFEGKLLEEFDKEFNMVKVAEENKMFYVKIAKHLMYLKELKKTNGYMRRFEVRAEMELKGRQKIIYEEITWGIDVYAQNQQEYDSFIALLNDCINQYKLMVGQDNVATTSKKSDKPYVEEVIIQDTVPVESKTERQRVLDVLSKEKLITVEELAIKANVKDIDGLLSVMGKNHEVYEPSPGKVSLL